jgi:RNase P subunit RPR2
MATTTFKGEGKMKKFPLYHSHYAAKQGGCFNCCADLTGQEHKESGYPEGKFQVKCPKCGFTKFYDVEEEK